MNVEKNWGEWKLGKIVVIFTGGTIAMKEDPKLKGAVPYLKGKDLIENLPLKENVLEIETIEFGNYPSPHLTVKHLEDLREIVEKNLERNEIDGIVITHGTDTLEETAYFLELTTNSEKPIVITGAMKSSSEIGYDGPSNLADALITASSKKSKNRGVLVVLNGEIHSAKDVTKTHTSSLDTFKSLETGPLGYVDNGNTYFYRNVEKRQYIPSKRLEPRVSLLKVVFGMDDKLIKFLVENGEKGIVIEGTGRGNVPPKVAKGIEYAISKDIPVVLVSRCPIGRVYPSYAYEGGGAHLKSLGVIFGGNLSGQKARVKLMVALAYTSDFLKIKELFAED